MSHDPRHRRVQWALFIGLWLIYAATIDKRDLQMYELHHTGAQALVEHHRFWYREHVPGTTLGGPDRFDFQGKKVYPNKQPGSIMAGALVYALLRPLGLDYLRSYFLTAALVTVFTSALLTAIAAVLVYRVVLDWTWPIGVGGGTSAARSSMDSTPGGASGWALLASLGYGLGTTAWPYSGTLHHDAMAAALLFVGFYWLERRPLASGALLGLAITTSMLVWPMTAVLALFRLARRGQSLGEPARFVAGLLLGLAPLLVYDQVSFGNPFTPAMVVSGHWIYAPARIDAETPGLFWEYLRLAVAFVPVSVLGTIGVAMLPASHRRERALLLPLVAVHLGFVVLIHADGACQYGPRMLLPLLPFTALGLAGFAMAGRRALAGPIAATVAAISTLLNLPGALYGTHFCPHDKYAVALYLRAARSGERFSLPLLEALGLPRGEASREGDRMHAGWLADEARVAVALGDLPLARSQLEVAGELAPDLPVVQREAARVAYLEGDVLGAVAALERAVAAAPDDPRLRAELQKVRAMVGTR